MAGKTGLVIGFLHDSFIHIPIEMLVRERKHIDPDSIWWTAVLAATGQPCDSASGSEAFAYRYLSIAQRYAEVRKGMGLKFVGYATDSILQMLVAKINQEAEVLYVPLCARPK